MTAPKRQTGSSSPRTPSANDRFKAQRGARVGWSMMLAVGAHVALFNLWPTWAGPERPDDVVADPSMEWIFLRQIPDAAFGAGPAPVRVAGEGADSAGSDPDVDAVSGDGRELSALAGALNDRLLRSGGLAPTIARSEPEPPVDEPPVTDRDSTMIGGDATATEIPEGLGNGRLDLDRLSDLRPELALGSISSWVLIRNPNEVERFMRRASRRPVMRTHGEASVSVTLWIDERGSVEWTEISESSGRPELDELALALFTDVVAFRPARDEGIRVPKSVIFTVNFPW